MTSRNWMATVFDLEWNTSRCTTAVKFLRGQMEVAPTTNRKHYQLYFELTSPMRLNGAQKALGSKICHLDKAEGTLEQCLAYVSKEETRHEPQLHFAIGDATMAKKKICSNEVAQMVVKRRLDLLIKDDPESAFHHAKKIREFKSLLIENEPMEDVRRVLCIFISGPTAIGKTGSVFNLWPSKHIVQAVNNGTKNWWIEAAYDPVQHSVLLVDEVKEKGLDEAMLCTWTSNYPQAINVKSATIRCQWSVVVITSNFTFNQCFDDPAGALRRRMSVIIEVGTDKAKDGDEEWDLDWLPWVIGSVGYAPHVNPPLNGHFAKNGCWTKTMQRDLYYWNLKEMCMMNQDPKMRFQQTPFKKWDLGFNSPIPSTQIEADDVEELMAEEAMDRLRHTVDESDGHVFDE